ncbi:MAG: glutathione S-transferase [Pseudomonadota bacterium]
MNDELAIGDRLFSSWSLRAWQLFAKFNIPVRVRQAGLYSPAIPELLTEFAPSRTVPSARLDGDLVWDSLALAETLAERHPDADLWPKDRKTRAFARSVTAEMHSGFLALRKACAMDVRRSYPKFEASDEVNADVARIEKLWDASREFALKGPWLFGAYSIADAFYAPIAMRFATYGLGQSNFTKRYVQTHLTDPDFRRWRAMGFAENHQLTVYDLDQPVGPWPGPKIKQATAVQGQSSQNNVCPYSGKPVTHVLEMNNIRWGFCNAFCRDKTVADPEAWPEFMMMVDGKQ